MLVAFDEEEPLVGAHFAPQNKHTQNTSQHSVETTFIPPQDTVMTQMATGYENPSYTTQARQAAGHSGSGQAYAGQQQYAQNRQYSPRFDTQYQSGYTDRYTPQFDTQYQAQYQSQYPDPFVDDYPYDAYAAPQGYTQQYDGELYIPQASGVLPPNNLIPENYGSHYNNNKKKKGGSATLVIAVILLLVGIALLAVAIYYLISSQQAYKVGIDEYTSIQNASVTEDPVSGRPTVDFDALQRMNSDIQGWISIPGTPINYPVCQHDDNDYYLTHTFLDTYNVAGAIFMDYRCDPNLQDRTTAIYGHYLNNGEMFQCISEYSNQDQFDTIGSIYYVSNDGVVHVLTPLSCMVVSGYDIDIIQFDFVDEYDFKEYVQYLISRSRAFAPAATAEGVEHVYLLSTCSYERENDRTILVCTDWGANFGDLGDATGDLNDIQNAADEAAGYWE